MHNKAKVRFLLRDRMLVDWPCVEHAALWAEPEEDWPPVESEGLWAQQLGDARYRINNIPWFARNLAVEDEIKAVAGSDGVLWAVEKVNWSGHLTIRVIPFSEGPLAGSLQAVLDAFSPLGVDGEGIEQYGMVALDIPPEVALVPVIIALRKGEADSWWDFEEGCVSDEWCSL